MTANKRIFLNIVATYGRSLYALAVGLFTARWALQALGKTDYGLVGLVGGLTGFVSFFNNILASAVGRFYGVSVGAANKKGNELEGLEECRKWFNTALSIHTLLPLLLIAVGYPIGVWAVRNFLTIPPDRVTDCIWVWRFTCVSCFVGMVNVPFNAMYTAKQEIAELTIYSFFTTTANACFLYYMISHPGIWLAKYSFGMMLLSVLPQLVIVTRAVVKYRECRFVRAYWYDIGRYRELAKYAFARFWASFSRFFSTQMQSLLVNKYMGPDFNASMSVGNTLAKHAMSLTGSLTGAFWPVITNLAGEGKIEEMNRTCFMVCRLATVLMLIFVLPLSLEVDEVLHVWLINPPDFAAKICLVIMIRQIFEHMTDGYWMGILGRGIGVMKYSWIGGWAGISTGCVAWVFFYLGYGMWSVVIGLSVSKVITVVTRLVLGKSLIGFRVEYWFRHVGLPIMLLSLVVVAFGAIPRFLLPASLLRIVITTVVCEVVFLPSAWLFVLQQDERAYIADRFSKVIGKIAKKSGRMQ